MAANDGGGTEASEDDVWRQRLADAERRYRDAIRRFSEIASGGSPEAVEAAAKRKDVARQEFHRVLRIFGDIVIRGKSPRNHKP